MRRLGFRFGRLERLFCLRFDHITGHFVAILVAGAGDVLTNFEVRGFDCFAIEHNLGGGQDHHVLLLIGAVFDRDLFTVYFGDGSFAFHLLRQRQAGGHTGGKCQGDEGGERESKHVFLSDTWNRNLPPMVASARIGNWRAYVFFFLRRWLRCGRNYPMKLAPARPGPWLVSSDIEAEVVGGAVSRAAIYAAAGDPDGEAVVSGVGRERHGGLVRLTALNGGPHPA